MLRGVSSLDVSEFTMRVAFSTLPAFGDVRLQRTLTPPKFSVSESPPSTATKSPKGAT